MRLILILLIAVVAFVVVQNYRHDCKWGEDKWFDCILGRAPVATTTPTTEAPSPSPEPSPAPQQ